jgi:hypothetical protein
MSGVMTKVAGPLAARAQQGDGVRRVGINEHHLFDHIIDIEGHLLEVGLFRERDDRLRESAFAVAIGGKADIVYCTAYVRL